MKVLAINGSPRGEESQTLRLATAVLAGAGEKGAETSLVDVCTLDIGYCTGCGACYITGECTLGDDFGPLFDRMLEADGIVFASPNYINSVTAQFKTMLDRMADAIHCQRFTGKYGCAVSTAGGSGADEVAEYLNGVLSVLGATTVGKVGVVIGGDPAAVALGEEQAFRLGGDLAEAIRTRRSYPEQEAFHAAMKERMRQLVLARKDEWTHEYEFWKEMGWFD